MNEIVCDGRRKDYHHIDWFHCVCLSLDSDHVYRMLSVFLQLQRSSFGLRLLVGFAIRRSEYVINRYMVRGFDSGTGN